MRRARTLLGLVTACAAVAALFAWGTCGEPATDGPTSPQPPKEPPNAPHVDTPQRPAPTRRTAPRAAAPTARDADDVGTPPPTVAHAADGPPRTVVVHVVSVLGALEDVRVRAWSMSYQPVLEFQELTAAQDRRTEVALGAHGGDASFTVPATAPRVIAYANARGVHTLGVVFELDSTLEGTIRLGSRASVEGTVYGTDGKPVAGAAVKVIPLGRPASGRAGGSVRMWAQPGAFEFYVTSVESDAAGRYRLPGVPTPPVSGAVPRVAVARDAAGGWWRGEEFVAEREGQTFTADVRLGVTPYEPEPEPIAVRLRVRGRVADAESGAGVEGARVALRLPSADVFPLQREGPASGEDGAFDFETLWDGGGARTDVRVVVTSRSHRMLTVPLGDEPLALRLERAQGPPVPGRVHGRVLGPGDVPVPGPRRLAFRQASGEVAHHDVLVGVDGRFTAEGVAPDWWQVWTEGAVRWVTVDLAEDGDVESTLRVDGPPAARIAWNERDEAELKGLRDALEQEREAAILAKAKEGSLSDSEVEEAMLRRAMLEHRVSELEERRKGGVVRRDVVITGIVAPGRAWLDAERDGERWVAEVRAGDAGFPALYSGTWTCTLRCAGAQALRFHIDIPEGRGPASIAMPPLSDDEAGASEEREKH